MFSIEPANCYFCLLNPYDVGVDGNRYLICFVTECNRGLDSFRAQLDEYAQQIEGVLRATQVIINHFIL